MLVETLCDVLAKANPDAEIEGIAFDVSAQERWMPDIKWHERIGSRAYASGPARLLQAFYLAIACAMAASRLFLPLRFFLPKRQRDAIEALSQANVAISCPGGYLEDSNFAYVLNLLQMLIARQLCAQVILAPQSIGPIRSTFGRNMLRFTLERMGVIYVREAPSREFLQAVAPGLSNVRLAGDLAFWYDHKPGRDLREEWERLGIDPQRPVLGMTVVGWNFPQNPAPDAAQQAYLQSLIEVARQAHDELSYQVVIFNQVSFDLPVAEQVAKGVPGIIVDRFVRDSGTLSALIAKCDVFVGSRFHSCVFALLGAVPTVAISYLPKTSGIMADLGLSQFTIPIDAISPDRVRQRLNALMADRDRIATELPERIDEYRLENGQFVRDISVLAGSNA